MAIWVNAGRTAAILILALAGCLENGPTAPDDRVADSGGDSLRVSPPSFVDASQIANEPAIVELPDGTLVVAGCCRRNFTTPQFVPVDPSHSLLWRSRDAGATWETLLEGSAVGQIGRSDVDLAAGPDGELYVARLSFFVIYSQDVIATAYNTIQVGMSRDGGDTWTWGTPLDEGFLVDRPWVRVAPDGSVHVVWNDGQGIYHATSTDDGLTWQEGPQVHAEGGDGGFDIGPNGELAVRVVPSQGNGIAPRALGTDGVSVSTDGGATWEFRSVPGDRYHESDGNRRFWDPVAFDASGLMSTVWPEGGALWMAVSDDLGVSWRAFVVADGLGLAYFPFLRGGSERGEALATWYSRANETTAAHLALIVRADAEAQAYATVLQSDEIDAGRGEYFQAIFLDDGGIGVVVPGYDESQTGLRYYAAHLVQDLPGATSS